MFTIQLTIQVDIKNYVEIVKQQKGTFTGSLINFLVSDERIAREIDAEVCKRMAAELPETMRQEMIKTLSTNGVKAEVAIASRSAMGDP